MNTRAIDVLEKEYTLSPHARFLKKHGMYSAALFYKNLNETLERRAARALRYRLEQIEVPDYEQGQVVFATRKSTLYGAVVGDDLQNYGCWIGFDGCCFVDEARFLKLQTFAETEQDKNIIQSIIENARNMYSESSSVRYLHHGTHNVIDFAFILENGIDGYRKKIQTALDCAVEEETIQFEQAMLDIVDGILNYLSRYLQKLKQTLQTAEGDTTALQHLIAALENVPQNPPSDFYEAYLTMHASMHFSCCFEVGRVDNLLYPYYEKDKAAGKTTKEEAVFLMKEMFSDIEQREGHPGATHVTIGGTKADGSADYNELTDVVMLAIRGLRMPNISLRVRSDMPQYLWDTYLENMGKGYAQPAIVNEKLYLDGLVEQYHIPFEDAVQYVFGGCSEVMIQGKTMCDSTWVAYNMLDIFEHTMYNHLLDCDSFEEFYERLKKDICVTLRDMSEQTNIRQHKEELHYPYPMRTLMTGDCIENGKSFTGGGAKYNFDSTNIYGTTNTINAVYTVKQLYAGVFGKLSKEDFLKSFAANYQGYEEQYNQYKNVQKFGNYNEEINEITTDLMGLTFNKIKQFTCYRANGQFMPAVILWVTWIPGGAKLGATPDGRSCSEPLADSSGPMQGTDTEGPTSTLGATLAIPQKDCVGTCILNLRLDSANFTTPQGREKVQQLLKGYFVQGGCQLQVNVVDPETLKDAMEHPDKHRDLIVRVGGFSDNFVLLDEKIKEQILLRTEFQVS